LRMRSVGSLTVSRCLSVRSSILRGPVSSFGFFIDVVHGHAVEHGQRLLGLGDVHAPITLGRRSRARRLPISAGVDALPRQLLDIDVLEARDEPPAQRRRLLKCAPAFNYEAGERSATRLIVDAIAREDLHLESRGRGRPWISPRPSVASTAAAMLFLLAVTAGLIAP